MKTLNTLILFLIVTQITGQKKFVYNDSLILISPIEGAFNTDIFFLDKNILARFDHWTKDSNYVYLVNKAKNYKFSTKDSNILTGVANIFNDKNGFVIPKYYGEKIMVFDTVSNRIFIDPAYNHMKVRKKTTRPRVFDYTGHNTESSARNDISFLPPYVLFNCITHTYNISPKSFEKQKRQIKRLFEKNKSFLLYDIEEKKGIRSFGNYPSGYLKDFNNIVNSHHYFVTDPASGLIYSSYQADPCINVYNLDGILVKTIIAEGVNIQKDKLNLSLFSKNVVKYKTLYNSLCDSYDEVYLYDNTLFRTYSLSLPTEVVLPYLPEEEDNACVPVSVIFESINLGLTKPKYLQMISLESGKIEEVAFPEGVNTFLGFDKSKKSYYFKNVKYGKGNIPQGKATVYEYKIDSIN